jgi:hypothetical protein
MAQVDSENSTAMPTRPAGALTTVGLARQNREREKALRRLAKLRRKASDEIERLIGFLDASDPYAAGELEQGIDDEPHDTNELEQGWTGLTANAANMLFQDWVDEAEGDGHGREADYEPSLGGVEGPDRGGQVHWAQGSRADLEEQSDDEGVTA